MIMSRIIPFFIFSILVLLPKISTAWDFMFSQKDYSNNLIVQAQIANKGTIGKLINDTNDDLSNIAKETNSELAGKPNYLFVRVKNIGNLAAWGELSCNINERKPIEIDTPSLAANMSYWNHYVITFGGIIFPKSEKEKTPRIECSWDELYAK